MKLGETQRAEVPGQRMRVDRRVAHDVHARPNEHAPIDGMLWWTIAIYGHDREARTKIGQRDSHRPRAPERSRVDDVPIRCLERIAYRYRVRIDLESPDAIAHSVEEVRTAALVLHHLRRADTGNPSQLLGV